MRLPKLFTAIVLAAAAPLALAQGNDPWTTPRPAPGERIDRPPLKPNAAENRALWRCNRMSGALREQCLREIGASSGATRGRTDAPAPPVGRDPRTAPPPQVPKTLR